uniref:X-epilectin n=1 Tax=Xenopus tropicalis TaxID=8364 RepID=F6YUZ9_XENTR
MKCIVVLLACVALGWAQSCNPQPGAQNLAISGAVRQSSTYAAQYPAEKAVDGIKDTNTFARPCAITGYDKGPWWQLDLKKNYRVGSMVIVNRGDCCADRLKGAEIRVGSSPDNNNPVCGIINDFSNLITTLCCDGKEGRYVSVVIPGRNEYLNLCELEVYGQEVKAVAGNVALLGVATQSSNYRSEYGASNANDGNKNANMMKGSCSLTGSDNPAWWQLDLKKPYSVEKVVIVNRGDCCWERLQGAEVRVGSSTNNKNPVCGTVTDTSQGTITLSCNGMEGRYVSVVIPRRAETLQLCEVEVYGVEAAVNVAGSGEATQSSTYGPMYNAATAIDGNTNSNMMAGSCSHTGNDNPAWWQLDLKKPYRVEKVLIVNRGDCCGERLLGAEVRVGSSSSRDNPVCGVVTDVSKPTITLSCNGMGGRYVSVVIPGRPETLQLCEVEVYAKI